jgi:hypothetical protein
MLGSQNNITKKGSTKERINLISHLKERSEDLKILKKNLVNKKEYLKKKSSP